MTIIPLSIDGALPRGFIAHIQSTNIQPGAVTLTKILPGLARKDPKWVIDLLVDHIAKSGSWRGAEANFVRILPFLGKATEAQIKRLLEVSAANGEVMNAVDVASKYLPPLVVSHGHLIDPEMRKEMEATLALYARE